MKTKTERNRCVLSFVIGLAFAAVGIYSIITDVNNIKAINHELLHSIEFFTVIGLALTVTSLVAYYAPD
ncbi:MAG: hypothetical protein WC666_00085 [Candidatus Paceibacterota bacterium]|jgi:hypothetical protein